jgi:protein phosphatase 1 regulatory subunit 7
MLGVFRRFLNVSLQANDNEIADWNTVDQLKFNPKLETVYLERNPLARDVQYRMKLKLAIPWLKKIDATLCTS